MEPTAAGHHGCWPPAVFHAEIAGAMDCRTQGGLPLPQTGDQVDSQTWQVYLSGSGQTPGQCSPASLKLPFGCCVSVLSPGEACSGLFFFYGPPPRLPQTCGRPIWGTCSKPQHLGLHLRTGRGRDPGICIKETLHQVLLQVVLGPRSPPDSLQPRSPLSHLVHHCSLTPK